MSPMWSSVLLRHRIVPTTITITNTAQELVLPQCPVSELMWHAFGTFGFSCLSVLARESLRESRDWATRALYCMMFRL
jgi:hypothetical protein